jgi:hypothetical protein
LCDYCEEGRLIKSRIDISLKEDGYTQEEPEEIEKTIEIFKTKISELSQQLVSSRGHLKTTIKAKIDKYKQLLSDLEDYEAIIYHKNVAKSQRSTYNEQHKNVEKLTGKILIELDFKEKVQIGFSPRQISKEFYNMQSRSFLGKTNDAYVFW